MSNRELSNRIEYFVGCIGAFAEKYSLSNSQAYKYLKRFSGLDFLRVFECQTSSCISWMEVANLIQSNT